MRYFIFILIISLSFSLVTSQPTSDCSVFGLDGDYAEYGQISPDSANNLRAEPDRDSQLLGQIPASALVTILDGPLCTSDMAWWRVRYENLEGWTVGILDGEEVMSIIDSLYFEGAQIANISPDPIIAEVEGESPRFISFHMDTDNRSRWRAYFQMRIYHVREMAENSALNADRLTELRYLLTERPDLSTRAELPYVGGAGSAQILHTQEKYIELPNITGIRYLTTYAQNSIPIDAGTLRYEFTGLTTDNRYIVNLQMPVYVDALPQMETQDTYSMDFEQYDVYLAGVMETLQQDNLTVKPSLSTLDSLLGTIKIETNVIGYDSSGNHFEPTYRVDWDYGACENADFPSRLEVGMVVKSTLSAINVVGAYTTPYSEELEGFYREAGWNLAQEDRALIIDGPACGADGKTYWLVYQDRYRGVGWVAESGVHYEDNKERYFLQQAPESTLELPPAFEGQTPTGCQIRGALSSPAYDKPNSYGERLGTLVRGVPYYVDAYYYPEEGGFQWWRVTPGATLNRSGETVTLDSPVWVFASSVIISEDCESIPTITTLD